MRLRYTPLLLATASLALAQGTGPYGERVQQLNSAGTTLTTAYYSVPPSSNALRAWDNTAKIAKHVTSSSLAISFSGPVGTLDVDATWLDSWMDGYVSSTLGTAAFDDTGDFETPSGAQAKANAAQSASNSYTDTAIAGLPAPFSGVYADLTGKPSIPTDNASLTNGAGYITSSALSPYATTAALTSGLATKFDNPGGNTGQYLMGNGVPAAMPTSMNPTAHTHPWAQITGTPSTLSGYGITDAYPLSSNPAGYLTGITSGQITTALGYTPAAAVTRSFANPSRSLNTAFQIDASRDAFVSYTVDVATTLTLTGGATGTVTLQYADNVGMSTNLVTVQSSVNGNTGTLTVGLTLTQTSTAAVSGIIPGGKYVRIVTTNTAGTPIFTARAFQEVKL